jgi:hypothetical protein
LSATPEKNSVRRVMAKPPKATLGITAKAAGTKD